jgi:hypothetical protein
MYPQYNNYNKKRKKNKVDAKLKNERELIKQKKSQLYEIHVNSDRHKATPLFFFSIGMEPRASCTC